MRHDAALTLDQAREVRRRYEAGESLASLERWAGIAYQAIQAIVHGRTYREDGPLSKRRRRFTDAQVQAARARRASGATVEQIATELGTSFNTAWQLLTRRTYKDVA